MDLQNTPILAAILSRCITRRIFKEKRGARAALWHDASELTEVSSSAGAVESAGLAHCRKA